MTGDARRRRDTGYRGSAAFLQDANDGTRSTTFKKNLVHASDCITLQSRAHTRCPADHRAQSGTRTDLLRVLYSIWQGMPLDVILAAQTGGSDRGGDLIVMSDA